MNSEVTDYYTETVALALERAGYETETVAADGIAECVGSRAGKDDWFFSADAVEACRLRLRGFSNVILWCQGVIPEESYLRHRSKVRARILSLIERHALKKASFCLFVSDAMRRHYEEKYKLGFEGRCFVMPCFNSELVSEFFFTEGKYDSPTFCYVGSLAAWQCFEQTVDLYKDIESCVPGARLKVLTFEQDEALGILKSKGVERFELGCVPPDKVAAELADVSYGFVLREDNIVNRVATPTKFSSYMSAGVIPIFSDCLDSFANLARGLRFAVSADESVDAESVVLGCSKVIRREDVLAEYRQVFDTYYSREYYIEKLAPLLSEALGRGDKI